MPNIDLNARFPHMKPVSKAPSLHLINGIGTRVYGKRDLDAETGAYVTTLCFCLLFVPIVFIRAYRVLPSPRGGWYFLGTEALSIPAKCWNLILALAIVTTFVAVGAGYYTGTPEYKAKQQMSQAHALVAKDHLDQAAAIYSQLALANSFEADNATRALKDLVETSFNASNAGQAARVFSAAARISTRPNAYTSADLVAKGMQLAVALADASPQAAISLLDAIRPLAVDSRDIDKARLPLLQKWVAAEPQNMEAAIALASLLDQQHQLDDAKKLLLPFKDKLGNGDGARILGSIYVHEGSFDDAYILLWPYVKPRLDSFHAAEKNADDIARALSNRELQALNDNKGPQDFYRRYEAAAPDQKDVIVHEYLVSRMKNNPDLQAAQDAAERETAVVPVALELGIAMLQRAQAQHDPAKRTQQLEETKNIFLSIQSAAGESDQFRLFLGQVYYWLGKQADGRKLFDEFLASKSRSSLALSSIAGTLRELGSDSEARTLAEEAYGKGNAAERTDAAYVRSLLRKDIDDEIDWLQKCNSQEPLIKASLAAALASKAMQENRDQDAITQFRVAIDAYTAMPRSKTSLNDMAIAYSQLFMASGDPRDREHCLDSIQQAIGLDPSDPVLLFNCASIALEASLVDIIGKDLDLRALRKSGDVELLRFLYRDQAGQDVLAKRIAEHPGIARALSYLDKSMVVSPKHVRSYADAFSIDSFTHDQAALRALEQRIVAADVDTSDALRQLKDFLAGVDDKKHLVTYAAAAKRTQDIAASLQAKGGPSYAAALSDQAEILIQLDRLGSPCDPAQVVDLAVKAHQAAPSSATSSMLQAAYQFRAVKDLRKSDPAFDQFAQQYLRSLGEARLFTCLLARNDELSKKIAADPSFQQSVVLMKEEIAHFPAFASPDEWALLIYLDPPLAQKIADTVRGNPELQTSHSIAYLLNPASAGQALDAAWLHQILNQPAEAKAILQKTAALGIPIPPQN